jgi:predicted RecA/RadA family phage recombinase
MRRVVIQGVPFIAILSTATVMICSDDKTAVLGAVIREGLTTRGAAEVVFTLPDARTDIRCGTVSWVLEECSQPTI